MSNWYTIIARDVSKIPEAIKHFETELQSARYEIKIKGNVEKQSADLPGVVENRFHQLQEIEAILEYLNIELRRLRSKFFKKYLENYQRALSSRDVEKYVDGEAVPSSYEQIADVEEYTEDYLVVGESYRYSIMAKADENMSEPTEEVPVTPEFPEFDVTVSASDDYNNLLISWTDACEYESGYQIEIENDLGDFEHIYTMHTDSDDTIGFSQDSTAFSYPYTPDDFEEKTFRVVSFSEVSNNYSSTPGTGDWEGFPIIGELNNMSLFSGESSDQIQIIYDSNYPVFLSVSSDDIDVNMVSNNSFVVDATSASLGNKEITVSAISNETNLVFDTQKFTCTVTGNLSNQYMDENSSLDLDLSQYIPEDFIEQGQLTVQVEIQDHEP